MQIKNDSSELPRMLFTRDHLAYHVRRMRHERGWSQLQLAEASGLHRTHVSRLENAIYNATLETVDQIADAFGVRPFTLLEAPTGHQQTSSLHTSPKDRRPAAQWARIDALP